MVRYRLTVLLPIFVVLITAGLWLWSRQQYSSFVHPQAGTDWPLVWTDYTPVPLEVAGAINAPVATFAYPLYHLLHDESPKWKPVVLLLGVAILWTYVGFMLDAYIRTGKRIQLNRIAGAIGILFGLFVLLVTIPMHHIAAIYKAGVAVWSIAIWMHFATAFRRARSVPQARG
jgi:hypothetical protein